MGKILATKSKEAFDITNNIRGYEKGQRKRRLFVALTISGIGAIADYSETLSPWRKYDFENEIQQVVIQQGISGIGKADFLAAEP